MNNYIALFERLSKLPGLVSISEFEDLMFLLNDFERLHQEGYVFLEVHKDKKKTLFYVKLAPRGFSSLEEFYKNQKQDIINKRNLRATIIIAVATALNVFVTLFNFFLGLNNTSSLGKVISLIVAGIFIAVLTGLLVKEVIGFMFPKLKL